MEDVREQLAKGWIHGRVIIEILGSPKEHVAATLQTVVENLKEEKVLKLLDININEPVLQEGSEKLYTGFVETELLFKNADAIVTLCFDYMPSSIELSEPEKLSMDILTFSNFFNDIIAKLHQVDMRLKQQVARNNILERNAANMLKNAILVHLSTGPKSISELSKAVGIAAPELKGFLERFAEQGFITEEGGQYRKK